jgi:hypothetical protein
LADLGPARPSQVPAYEQEKPHEDAREQELVPQGSALCMYLTPKDILRIRSGAPLGSSGRLFGS